MARRLSGVTAKMIAERFARAMGYLAFCVGK